MTKSKWAIEVKKAEHFDLGYVKSQERYISKIESNLVNGITPIHFGKQLDGVCTCSSKHWRKTMLFGFFKIDVSEKINKSGFKVQYEHYLFAGEQGKRDSVIVARNLRWSKQE